MLFTKVCSARFNAALDFISLRFASTRSSRDRARSASGWCSDLAASVYGQRSQTHAGIAVVCGADCTDTR